MRKHAIFVAATALLVSAITIAARWPPHLRTLGLSGTLITDAGLLHLQKNRFA